MNLFERRLVSATADETRSWDECIPNAVNVEGLCITLAKNGLHGCLWAVPGRGVAEPTRIDRAVDAGQRKTHSCAREVEVQLDYRVRYLRVGDIATGEGVILGDDMPINLRGEG